MRVMREIISEHSGKPLSNQRLEDKFDYKALLYPSKANKKSD